jgi:radical SAM protein with 4Fe4S-binding SPASM domain
LLKNRAQGEEKKSKMEKVLKVISWNITRRCNLLCSHCYLPATFRSRDPQAVNPSCELSTEKAFQVIDQIADVNPEVMLILSGGEPLLRKDIFDLAGHASDRGMMVVLGTNGTLIDHETAVRLKQSGVAGVSISLDSTNPETHDGIRLVKGSWKKAIEAIKICRSIDLSVQINTMVTKNNFHEIAELIQYARSLGANVFSPFFLVCTGRGEELTDITPGQYEEVLSLISNVQRKRGDMMIRTRCAPTFRRILYQSNPESNLLKLDAGKCMAGLHYCRIAPEGTVTPCPYMNVTVGNLRDNSFSDIWNNSEEFTLLRSPSLKGKCGACEFSLICGGCRARAYAEHNDMMDEDPWCVYPPKGGDTIPPPVFNIAPPGQTSDDLCAPLWSDDAETRLEKIPFFVRSMVKGAVEQYALRNKYKEITPAVMAEARQNCGMGKMARQ